MSDIGTTAGVEGILDVGRQHDSITAFLQAVLQLVNRLVDATSDSRTELDGREVARGVADLVHSDRGRDLESGFLHADGPHTTSILLKGKEVVGEEEVTDVVTALPLSMSLMRAVMPSRHAVSSTSSDTARLSSQTSRPMLRWQYAYG